MLIGGESRDFGYIFVGRSVLHGGIVAEVGWGWRDDAAEGEMRWIRNYSLRLRSPVRFRKYPDGMQVIYFGRCWFWKYPNAV